jgi:hypothetical protein
MKIESKITKRWIYKDDPAEPFPEREFYQPEGVDRGYGDWGGIYDEAGNPLVGCNEYMVFKDRETAELIVKAVNFYLWHHDD